MFVRLWHGPENCEGNSTTLHRRILLRQVNSHVHTGHELLEGGIHVADDLHTTEGTGEGFQGVLRGRVFEVGSLRSSPC